MKKITLTLIAFMVCAFSWAQIITTNPAFITQSAGGTIDIIYDASQGGTSAGLKDYAGTDGVYAHTGVITSASTSSSDWKHAPTWGDNSDKYKMTSLGSNKWKLTITPSLSEYYNLATSETVTKIAFVFRNGLKTKEGKGVGATDIMVDVYQAGLNVAFVSPSSNQAVTVGTAMNISFNSSVAANLNLLINGTSVKTLSAATSLTYSYTFASADDYSLIAEATASGITVRDTVKVCVPAAVINETRPSGTVEGINYTNSTTATLVLYAPGKNNVFLIGEFNDWAQLNSYQMKKDGNYWWYTLTNLTPGKIYGFQYLVDGTNRVSDPYTELVMDPWNDKWINQYNNIFPDLKSYPEGKTDGLAATLQTSKPAYNWEITNFAKPANENMVIYELLLRDFTPEKSLNAAINKLDYLKNLGITAIELMPIQEFDGNNSWGYNPNHYFAPDKAYGTPDTYKKFIDECHKRGIAVILDIVLNHATGICPFAKLYWNSTTSSPTADNPWMNVTAPHPYSVNIDFNHTFSGTKEYFKRMVQYWITEYKVDGYRLDLTKGFTQTSSTEATASNYDQSRIDNITAYYDAAKAVKPDVMFILEHFCNNDEETALANKGMFLWRKMNNAYSQAAMGYQTDSDFGGMNSFPRRWVGYAESHDEERNFYKAKTYGAGNLQTDSISRVKRVPLNIAFTTLLPGPKMIYEFSEMGYDYSIGWYLDQYGVPQLDMEKGRTFSKPVPWSWLNLAHRKAASDASAKIMTLRRLYPNAFTQGTYTLSVGFNDWANGRRIALSHADLNLVVLGNFNASTSITANPSFPKTGTWYNLLTGEELNVTNTSMTIDMLPGTLAVYTDRKINIPNSIENTTVQNNCLVYPTVTEGKVFISTSSQVKKVLVYNLQGMLVKTAVNTNEVDLSSLNNGLYLFEVNTTQGKEVYKITKE